MNSRESPGRRIVMLLTNEYRPDPRVRKEALALARNNYSVKIVAWDRNHARPTSEGIEGVWLERVRTGNVGSRLHVALNYPLFAAKAILRARQLGYEAIHAHDFDTLPIGLLLAWLKGVPLVFDAHEQYAQMIKTDVPGWLAGWVAWLERRLLSKVNLAITVNGRIAERMKPYAKGTVVVIMNAVEVPEYRARNLNREDGNLVLYYGGTLEPMRYIEETIMATSEIDKIHVIFAGNGRLKSLVERAAVDNKKIEFHGFLPHPVMLKEMAEADVVLCLIDPDNQNYADSLPNKVCEAMALGMPIITSKKTYAGELVARLGLGSVIHWSIGEFREAIETLRNQTLRQSMGNKGRQMAEKDYNWAKMEQRLISAYAGLPWIRH